MFHKLLSFALLVVFLTACAPSIPTAVPVALTPTPVNISPILEGATQVREERIYLVTLKFKRHDYLDPIKNWTENEIKAEHQTLIVGQKTYDGWIVGQEISNQFDTAGIILNGDIATYIVSVEDKQMSAQYYWQDKAGTNHEITADEYSTAIQELSKQDNITTVPFSGTAVTYVLDKPVSEYKCETSKPLARYFIKILVKNESITLDLSKIIRNATNVHHIEMEVPQVMYDEAAVGEMWEPDWNVGSIIFSGRLSRLHGYVEERWIEEDISFNKCVTSDGYELILPAK